MRRTASYATRHPAARRVVRPLIVQAGIARTFGSLGSLLAVLFLGAGVYLLQQVLSDPLGDRPAGLISGAFVIALAVTLGYFIFMLRRGDAHK
jgi:hypothetical protein